jgi:capsular polysaccharide transport system permease protein
MQTPLQTAGLVGNPTLGSAIKALILRELLTRFGNMRYGWVFVLLEPIVHIGFMAVLFGLILGRHMPGVDYIYFITAGVLGFEIIMKSLKSGLAAIPANAALFVHKQVLPITVIMTRVLIETSLLLISGLVVWAGFAWVGHPLLPANPFGCLLVLSLMAVLGFGLALTLGILNCFLPIIEKIVTFINRPLYIFSGIFFSVRAIPEQYREMVLWNPIFTGIELFRGALLDTYNMVGVSLAYFSCWAFFAVLIGLSVNKLYGAKVIP